MLRKLIQWLFGVKQEPKQETYIPLSSSVDEEWCFIDDSTGHERPCIHDDRKARVAAILDPNNTFDFTGLDS